MRHAEKNRPMAVALLLAAFALSCYGQQHHPSVTSAPLVKTGAIPLPNVLGRIDHMGYAPDNRLFVSALGNNTVEVIDLGAQRVVKTITGVRAPQGVVYTPEVNKVFVASDEGKLYIFDGTSLERLAAIDFGDDVDNLRYDAGEKKVYVGYGAEQSAAIAVVAAVSNEKTGQEFKLGAHPESFQLEHAGDNIFVNLPDLEQIVAVNRKTGKIVRWSLKQKANFPMALDEAHHRLFVATRAPARMLAIDTESGRVVAEFPCVQDSDDLYYDAARQRIYVSGGEGYVSVFQQHDANRYSLLAKVPTGIGARTAGYFGRIGKKGFDRFYVAVPASAERGAELLIYTVQD